MTLDSNTSAGRDDEVVFYEGPRIVVTSRSIWNTDACYPVRDLGEIVRVHTDTHPARAVALICGLIEMGLAAPLAVAYGSAILFCAGFVAACGVATAILVDDRRNPRWMELHACAAGNWVRLFGSGDQQEFGHVRRAVIRAVEANRRPRP